MGSKLITLRSKEEMFKRLIAVKDIEDIKEGFYSILLMHEGQTKSTEEVVEILQDAISEYTKDVPHGAGMHRGMVTLLQLDREGFIDALIQDEEGAAEARAFFNIALNVTPIDYRIGSNL